MASGLSFFKYFYYYRLNLASNISSTSVVVQPAANAVTICSCGTSPVFNVTAAATVTVTETAHIMHKSVSLMSEDLEWECLTFLLLRDRPTVMSLLYR